MSRSLTFEQAEMMRMLHEELPHVPYKCFARVYDVHVDTVSNIFRRVSHTGEPKKPRRDRKYPDARVREVRELGRQGITVWHIARRTGIGRRAVQDILSGRSYADVP